MLHHRGERDAEPTDLEEHGRVGLLAVAIEADARGPEEVHAIDDDRVLVQNLVRDEEIPVPDGVETASMAWGPVEASKRRKIDFRTEECATSSVADPT